MLAAPARAVAADDETRLTMSVHVSGALPGFSKAETTKYLAARMSEPYVGRWRFAPGSGRPAASPNRVEWRFEPVAPTARPDPEFAPEPGADRPAGNHLLGAQLRLFIGGKYITSVFNQAAIKGGAKDEKLSAFIVQMTQDLLGLTGAYRSIERRQRR